MFAEKLLLGPSALDAKIRFSTLVRADSSSDSSKASPVTSSNDWNDWSVESSLMITLL
jgi:hypothetical protein